MRVLQFTALLLGAIALVPAGAHLFALPNKIGLAQDDYFIVQNIYRGWALFGVVLLANVVALAVLAFSLRAQRGPFVLVFVGLGCQLITLAIFFTFVFPANQSTGNWTEIPDNWEHLRKQWEYGHAVDAFISLLGFCAVIVSVLLTCGTPWPQRHR
jgi:hypothetical protein